MIISNSNGLSDSDAEKILRPYAKNKGALHNPKDAARQAVAYLEDNPNLLEAVGELLDNAQE